MHRPGVAEAVEVDSAGKWVQLRALLCARVVAMILQHVEESSPDLERRFEAARVISVGEDGTSAADARIQATRQAHG